MTDLADIVRHLFVQAHQVISNLSAVWAFLNSQFALTLVGTLIAAFAGVVGAHFITERFKRREQWLRELRVTNAAIMTSFEICNSMLAMKKQHVKELGSNYSDARAAFNEFKKRKQANQAAPHEVFYFQTDFQTLNPMLMPGDILLKQVYEQISPPARAFTLTSTLLRSIDSLNHSIRQRNDLIEGWKKRPPPPIASQEAEFHDQLARFYFGLRQQGGHIDTSYPNSIEAICSLTDDCIQFSHMLCSDLVKHGENLRKRLGRKAPRVNKPIFDKAHEEGLMPDEANYEDWLSMFVPHKKTTWKQFAMRLFGKPQN